MSSPTLSRLAPDASIVLVRLRSLGDTVLVTPAFSLLRQAVPAARIHVVMDERFADVLAGQPDIDGILRLEAGAGPAGKARLLRALRGLRPSLCLDMHGGTTAAWLTALSGARWRAGFAHFRQRWAYNVRIPRPQEVLRRSDDGSVHTAEHHASAIMHLSGQLGAIPGARLAAVPVRSEQPYAVLHAGAAYATKTWPLARFLALAGQLRERHGLEPVFVAGPGEADLSAKVKGFGVRRGLPLPDLMALLAGARLFVGNDSGPAHIAAAFEVPCVVVFGSSDSKAWHPWKTRHRVVETAWDCKPCPGDRCYAFAEPRCVLSVTPAAVERAMDDLLAECRGSS
ncbi:MAG: glycosyltransferase family 9 protein [Bryobacterales bacterium]|nr:glycosyltransferase family 9 protein [Bryobacterales bacterium]